MSKSNIWTHIVMIRPPMGMFPDKPFIVDSMIRYSSVDVGLLKVNRIMRSVEGAEVPYEDDCTASMSSSELLALKLRAQYNGGDLVYVNSDEPLSAEEVEKYLMGLTRKQLSDIRLSTVAPIHIK